MAIPSVLHLAKYPVIERVFNRYKAVIVTAKKALSKHLTKNKTRVVPRVFPLTSG